MFSKKSITTLKDLITTSPKKIVIISQEYNILGRECFFVLIYREKMKVLLNAFFK